MRKKKGLALFSIVAAMVFLGIACETPPAPVAPGAESATSEAVSASNGIVGTWRFVSRDHPEGAGQPASDIVGLLTYTGQYRNFNIYWKGPDGQDHSISYVARYQLSADSYSEESLYWADNNIRGEGLQYDFSGPTGTSPVTSSNGRMEFKLPLYDEPVLVFEGSTMTATREGEFVDHWEKVD